MFNQRGLCRKDTQELRARWVSSGLYEFEIVGDEGPVAMDSGLAASAAVEVASQLQSVLLTGRPDKPRMG